MDYDHSYSNRLRARLAKPPMIDISTTLYRAAAMRAEWDHSKLVATITSLQGAMSGTLDWDSDSGEEWARVVRDGKAVAMVRVQAPLVVIEVSEHEQTRPSLSEDVQVIEVPSFDAEVMGATIEALAAAFPERSISESLDPQNFSADGLWFATT